MTEAKSIYEILSERRPKPTIVPPLFRVRKAREVLVSLLEKCIGRKAKWLADYEKVVKWLSDSQYKGLYLYGTCGTGKTIIATRVIPFIIENGTGRPPYIHNCKARDLSDTRKVEEILNARVKIIDDIGTETPTNDYGIRRWAFCDVVDVAEERGQLLIVTTNLTSKDIRERYGERTFDRLRHICHPVHIQGESLRGSQQIAFESDEESVGGKLYPTGEKSSHDEREIPETKENQV